MSDTLTVLLGLRLKGFGAAEAIAEVVDADPAVVEAGLAAAAASNWALLREGRMSGWSITPDGRAEGERLLAAELDAAGCREAVSVAYESFLDLNARMLQVCTDWQMKDAETLNDHSDPGYDRAVTERLAAIHHGAVPICDDLAVALARFGHYRRRLEAALERVHAGEHDYFTGVRVASYHTVWFELHENLLATLGVDRAREGSG
ncbi:MAG: transcriptional regulator [Acidimicrobiia bacterium]|nr:transcriptional regulator [Acidimicrobiia bacterium]